MTAWGVPAASMMDVQVEMARDAAAQGKRTLICVASPERAVAVREQYGLVGHELIMVVTIDPPLHSDEPREVSFVSYEDVRAIPVDAWASLEPDEGE